MREIEGMDAAIEAPKPYWSNIEEDFHRNNMWFIVRNDSENKKS